MNYWDIIILGYLIGITIVGFWVLKRVIDYFPDWITQLIRENVEKLMNDKEIYDSIVDYITKLGKESMQNITGQSGRKPAGLLEMIIPAIFNRFTGQGNQGNQEQPKKLPEKPIIERVVNPFQKKQ
ncbi:MAG: hypothetical protein QXH07_07170 [Thermoplasmata archaeon]